MIIRQVLKFLPLAILIPTLSYGVEPTETIYNLDRGVTHIERTYNDWTTTKIIDPLDNDPMVLICARFTMEVLDNGRARFCFRILSPQSIMVEPHHSRSRGYWPHCNHDRIKYIIDEQPPGIIPKIKSAGDLCDNILDANNRKFLSKLENGKSLKLKIHSSRGFVSLNGYSDAWVYAMQQFK